MLRTVPDALAEVSAVLAWLSQCQVTLPKEESQDMLIDLQEDQLSVVFVTMSSYQQSRKHYFRCCAYVNQS